ncbi:BTB/POZ domain-containing protein At5g60050-like [Wolffia australiana]
MAAATADHILKRGHVSAMIRQGFLPTPQPSKPSPPSSSASPFSSSFFSSSSPSPSPPPSTTLLDMIAAEDRRPPPPPPPQPEADQVTAILAPTLRPDLGPGDVHLTVSSPAGFRVSAAVHRAVLAASSRFFAAKLPPAAASAAVEICDCHDPLLYLQAVALMYSSPPLLPRHPVPHLLSLLKVAAAMEFEAGVAACVEQLEKAPWTAEEEAAVVAAARRLGLPQAAPLLSRVSPRLTGEELLVGLLGRLLRAKDEKAAREMKALVKALLDEDRAAVPAAALLGLFRQTVRSLLAENLAAREAENLRWLGELLVGRGLGEELLRAWADQRELARAHYAAACKQRYEVSRVTAEICAAAGEGRIVAAPAAKAALLGTWLAALYEDFGWMRRAARGFDRRPIEEGLGRMILTLPMDQQQALLLDWFDRFLDKGDDCPDLRSAFHVWFRRAFLRP